MLTHYRRRRGIYPLAAPRPVFPRRLVATAVFAAVFLYFFGPGLLRIFGFGGPIERLAAVMSVEGRGGVNVMLEGKDSKPAENAMKLYAGEKLSTGGNAHASLRFPDGTLARLDQNTELTITDNAREKGGMRVALSLDRGSMWVLVPEGTGASVHTVTSPGLTFALPADTEAVLSPSSIAVLSAAGQGITVTLAKRPAVFVGEGQELSLPADALAQAKTDLYAYRSPLAATVLQSALLTESRDLLVNGASSGAVAPAPDDGVLTLRKPADGDTVGATVSVAGTTGPKVAAVKVNGYAATLDPDTHAFSQDVAVPDNETSFDIRVQALDENQNVLEEEHRVVKKGATTAALAVPSPEITGPAKTGETYRTSQAELVIRGNSPREAVAMYVNNYKLQLFNPAKGTWSYLASLSLGNMKAGTNTYDVVAEDDKGRKSNPARITIEQGTGEEGVVAAAGTSSIAPANPVTLPTNDPLAPGTLKVTGDAAQMGFVATGTGFLLEGTTSPQTAAVWVNNYRLQLYKPGATFWNYLASPQLKTLQTGSNVFRVVARDGDGKILDKIDVTVEYR